mmetsp:Transcript_28997/g.29374  ORF Transcript_28997/g.29374 Transcript_28997/m.29374 type:complete len:114 (+) Transcript_28997:1408-1749(+)
MDVFGRLAGERAGGTESNTGKGDGRCDRKTGVAGYAGSTGHNRGTKLITNGRCINTDGGSAQGTSTSSRLAGQWCQIGIDRAIADDGINTRKKNNDSQEMETHTFIKALVPNN